MISRMNLVIACYRALLKRDPDPAALAFWVDNDAPEFPVQSLLDSILMSEEYARAQPGRIESKEQLGPACLFNDQSQFGEIPLLLRQMVNSGALNRIVVDVGANGRARSNSYDLMRHFGWRGLLVEANPARNETIAQEFIGCDYELVNFAISDYVGEAVFHIGVNDDVSSLRVENAAAWGDVRGEVTVKVERLPALLQKHGIPTRFDLLSIDAEGEDVRILNDTVAGGFLPRWIIVEASNNMTVTSLDQLPLTQAVRSRYEIVDRTQANLILRQA